MPRSPLYEKSHTVLWVQSADGLLLHNFTTGIYLELTGPLEEVWARLDGTTTVQGLRKLLSGRKGRHKPSPSDFDLLLAALIEGQFVLELRRDGQQTATPH